jgi:hypothetical protein
MDLPALRALRTEQFEALAAAYKALSDNGDQSRIALENTIAARLRAKVTGATAAAAGLQLSGLGENFHYIQVECGLIAMSLRAFVADIASPKLKLDMALADAQTFHFQVADSGYVTYPEGRDADGEPAMGGTAMGLLDASNRAVAMRNAYADPNPHHPVAQGIADQIADALAEATGVDDKWGPQLRKLLADDDMKVSAQDWADVRTDQQGVDKDAESYLSHLRPPPANGDPKDNIAWWNSLSPQDKADYLTAYPDRVGALNGLPATVRDEANRTVLAEVRGDYQAQIDAAAIPPEPEKYDRSIADPSGRGVKSTEWIIWNAQYGDKYRALAHVRGRLKGMDAIQARFDQTGTEGLPEAYLLGYDPDGHGDGKIILANGNPDTADHTAVYIPGTKAKLDGIGGDLNRGVVLWQTSHHAASAANISTITWLDYDAPNAFVDARSDSYAHRGAPDLYDFFEGTYDAHQAATGTDSHVTAIGHSYGSTLIGDALQHNHDDSGRTMKVDDVIALGSPGMQARSSADLGVNHGHMWAAEGGGSDDIVTGLGRAAGLGGGGVIPSDPDFGGNVMASDTHSHSDYWDVRENGKPTLSLQNQADVIVGDYDKVKLRHAAWGGIPPNL